MKRIITIILALAMMLALATALAGCGERERPPAPLDDTRELIHEIDGGREEVRVPMVNLDSEGAAEINEHIAWAQRSFQVAHSDFFYARHGDMISLIFCMASADGNFEYHTFVFDATTGEAVPNAELLALAGWEFDALAENLRAKVDYFYEGQRDEDGNLPPPRVSPAQRIHDKMFSELTMPEVMRLYLDEEGNLFWVAQLSFGEGLMLEDGTVFGGRWDFVEVLMSPDMPHDSFAFGGEVMERFGWDALN